MAVVFKLLGLPLEMQALKPSILMGKLKQSLPRGVSPGNDLFLAGNHKTAADTLWDTRSGHDPTVAATTTHRSRSPAPDGGEERRQERRQCPNKKSHPYHPRFLLFQIPGNGVFKYQNYHNTRAHKCASPCPWLENYRAAEPLPAQQQCLRTP